MSVLSLIGVLGASWVIAGLAPGFTGAKRELTIALVRILFPGAGVLVLSAWCLGVLNVHGRFLLSYAAPIAWNVAMIATLVDLRPRARPAGAGGLPRVGIGRRQPRAARRPAATGVDALGGRRGARADAAGRARPCATSGRSLASRGAVQLTAYIDTVIASLLPTGAVTGLTNTQLLYTLPVSLFGISISSAALPSIAADAQASDALERVRARVAENATRIAYFTIPSAVCFLALGDVLAATLLQTGRFTAERLAIRLGHPGGLGGRAWWRRRRAGCTASRTTRWVTRRRRCASPIARLALATGARLRRGGLAAGLGRSRVALGRGGADGIGGRRGVD